MGHFNFDFLIDKGWVVVFLFDFYDVGDLFSNCLKAGLWLFDFDGDLNHGRHFNRHHFDVVLGNLHLLCPLDHLLLGG